MATRLEEIDTRTADQATLEALHTLYLARDRELEPAGDPPVPMRARLVDWQHYVDSVAIPRFALWAGASIVATSGAFMDLEQNLENAYGWVYVHPDHRGHDLGRAVATPMFDDVEKHGRTRFASEINQGRPEEKIAELAGMKPAYTEKRSRLSFPDVDWSLMDLWVKRAEERASDYELLFLTSPMPEEHVEAFCEVWQVMNTAPRDDFEEEDEVLTPEVLRDIEAKEAAKERELLTYVARHRPTGKFVGLTEVIRNRLQPDLAWQGDSGVHPEHRNKGLGRWLKAAMALHLRDIDQELRRIDTYNAGSNAPMLSINVEMGFKPVRIETVWQGDLALLRERLSV